MRYVRTLMLLLAGLSFAIPLLSKPLLASPWSKQVPWRWSENRWSGANLKHADADWSSPDPVDDSAPCIEPSE